MNRVHPEERGGASGLFLRRRGLAPLAALAFGCLTICGLARAQIEARQGTLSVDEAKRFASPMILTLPIPELKGVRELRDFHVAGIRHYRCEDASIASMTIRVTATRKGGRAYEISGLLLVDESFDRFVTVHFRLLGGGESFGQGRQMNIPVEEEKSNRFMVRIEVPEDRLEPLDQAAELALQLTMHVRKD